jgi:hypothetical protein
VRMGEPPRVLMRPALVVHVQKRGLREREQ